MDRRQHIIPRREVAASGVSFSALSSLCPGEVIEVAALTFRKHSVSYNMKSSNKSSEEQKFLRQDNRHDSYDSGKGLPGLASGDFRLLEDLFSRLRR